MDPHFFCYDGGGQKSLEREFTARERCGGGLRQLARGEFSLQRFLAAAVVAEKMRVREITAAEAPRFENWNGPASLPRG